MNFKTRNPNADEQKLQKLIEQVNFLSQEKKILADENENLVLKLKIADQKHFEKEQQLQNQLSIAQLQISENNNNNQNCDLDETVVVKSKRYVKKKVPNSTPSCSLDISHSLTYLRKLRPVDHLCKSIGDTLFDKKQSLPSYIRNQVTTSQVSYSNLKKTKTSTKKKKRNKSESMVKLQIKQEDTQIKQRADKAAENFIKHLDKKIQMKRRVKSKSKVTSKSQLKNSILNVKPNFNISRKGKSKGKAKVKDMVDSSTIDFKQILNNFSLTHKNKDLKPKLGNISFSTINHSLNHESQKNFFKKSEYTNLNQSVDPLSSSINIVFNKPLKKSDKAVMTDVVHSGDGKDTSGSSLNLDEMQENIPKKFEKLYSKLYAQIKKINRKNSNLERQLRNRNKDYIYALKEIENIKAHNTD
jgi:hypothetical protein